MDSFEIAINDDRIILPPGSPALDDTLLRFLRARRLTGAKEVCGEGGCGACTVIVSRCEPGDGEGGGIIRHRSVTACLVPLATLHRTLVTTSEGLSALSPDDSHPLADAFYKSGASQCGYCTPGCIMALAGRLSEGPAPARSELEQVFDGNLCRCTGYRPILDAASVFCSDPVEDGLKPGQIEAWRRRHADCRPLEARFPDAFRGAPQDAVLRGAETEWRLPVTLAGALSDHATVVAGNTDLGCQDRDRPVRAGAHVALSSVAEIQHITWDDDAVQIGAGVTIAQLVRELEARIPAMDPAQTSVLKALHNQCRFFANQQVRNVATVGGGVVNFSQYSDLLPLWVAGDAVLHLQGGDGATSLRLRDQQGEDGGLALAIPEGRLLRSIELPYSTANDRVATFKYSRRRLDAITLLSVGARATFDPARSLVVECVLCFDGLGPPGFRARRTEDALVNTAFSDADVDRAVDLLRQEVADANTNPFGDALLQHQARLAVGALLRFAVRVRAAFHAEGDGVVGGVGGVNAVDHVNEDDQPLLGRYPEAAHRSVLEAEESPAGLLGQAIPHRFAALQVEGTATYSADREEASSLYAAVVPSPVARGTIRGIDASQALAEPGVVAFLSAKDIPGKNRFGFRVQDEEVLPSDEVSYVGQPVGIVVATSERAARHAARGVVLDIEPLPARLDTESAREAGDFHGKPEGYLLEQGDLEQGFADAATVVTGRVEAPGQFHFYLEPQNALVVPVDGRWEVYSSTQSPTNVVDHVAAVLNVPRNAVDVRVGRIGGGFGGKQFRAGPVAAWCALAAHATGQPVKLVLSRAEDLAFCPGRSPFHAEYRAGFTADGRIAALDIRFDVDGGCSNDYSADITETATMLMDSAYRIDHVRVHGSCLRTNHGSYTSTRGFGKPQAAVIIESVLDHGGRALGLDPTLVRRTNLYREGDRTITKTAIEDDVAYHCFARAMDSAGYERLRSEVDAWNRSNRWFKRGIAAVTSKGNMGFLEADDLNRGLARVQLQLDGTVSVNHSGVEMGQGINTRMSQVAAQALGVALDDVVITDTQSAVLPNTPPTTMVATDLIGEALLQACGTLIERLQPYDGSLPERIAQAYDAGVDLGATGVYTAPRLAYDYATQQGDISYFFVWGAAVSVVEIDVISGGFRVLESHVVQDCGKSLNPHLDIGQAEGGFVFGVGYAMTEAIFRTPNGRLISQNVSDYKLPSVGDVPLKWNIELLNETPSQGGLHSSKGIGEANTQLGLSVYFATKDAITAARVEAGLDSVFDLKLPASVEHVTGCLPDLRRQAR